MVWLIKFAVFGLVIGLLARLFYPGRDPMGWFWTMILGMGGAALGAWVGQAMGLDVERGLDSWIIAILGAVSLLALYYFMTRRQGAIRGGDERR